MKLCIVLVIMLPQILDRKFNARCTTGCICQSVTKTYVIYLVSVTCTLQQVILYIQMNIRNSLMPQGPLMVLSYHHLIKLSYRLVGQRGYGEDVGEKSS